MPKFRSIVRRFRAPLRAGVTLCMTIGHLSSGFFFFIEAGPAKAETSSWTKRTETEPAERPSVRRKTAKPAAVPGSAALARNAKAFSKEANEETLARRNLVPATGPDAAYIAYDQGQYLTALKLANEAAQRGDAAAHTLAGRIYAEGQGVPKDEAAAAKWYARGAELGDTNAVFALGVLYAEGHGVPRDYAKAADLFERAARTGHALANYNLGLLFLKGKGKPENPYRAAQHIGYAARQGVAAAQYDYGTLCQFGTGVPFDGLEAARWISKAAAQGLPAAEYDYAVMLLRGQGLVADAPKAVVYLERAAEKGLPGAQNRLAYIYLEGAGVKKNPVEAVKWRLLAKHNGFEDAGLDKTIAALPPSDRQQAEVAAALWREGHTLFAARRVQTRPPAQTGQALPR